MIPGFELVVGYVIAWTLAKAKRFGAGADRTADRVVDAALERLDDVVSRRLGEDPSLARLKVEAAAGAVQERTVRRTTDAIEQAADDDPEFAAQLRALIGRLTRLEGPGISTAAVTQTVIGGAAVVNTGTVGGDVNLTGRDGA